MHSVLKFLKNKSHLFSYFIFSATSIFLHYFVFSFSLLFFPRKFFAIDLPLALLLYSCSSGFSNLHVSKDFNYEDSVCWCVSLQLIVEVSGDSLVYVLLFKEVSIHVDTRKRFGNIIRCILFGPIVSFKIKISKYESILKYFDLFIIIERINRNNIRRFVIIEKWYFYCMRFCLEFISISLQHKITPCWLY